MATEKRDDDKPLRPTENLVAAAEPRSFPVEPDRSTLVESDINKGTARLPYSVNPPYGLNAVGSPG